MVDPNQLPLPRLFETLTADETLTPLLEAARREDLGEIGDVSTASMIEAGWTVRAVVLARQGGVACGLRVIPRLLEVFECPAELETLVEDGDRCAADQPLCRLTGLLGPILWVERTMLNIVGRLSGIATLTARYVECVAGTDAVICDTRKTTPGLRSLEKYAVRCGGGHVHRLGLYDAVLFKDNHLAHLGPNELAPAVTKAATAARGQHDLRFVEVEVDDLEQLGRLLECPDGLIDMVLLDNMTGDQLREAVAMRDAAGSRILLEASGGIDLCGVRAVAETGVERISVGGLTHGVSSLDVSLEVS